MTIEAIGMMEMCLMIVLNRRGEEVLAQSAKILLPTGIFRRGY
jgi:hypothetical protein